MKGYFIKVLYMDPFPKEWRTTECASTIELAAKRAIHSFRKKEMPRRQVKKIVLHIDCLGEIDKKPKAEEK